MYAYYLNIVIFMFINRVCCKDHVPEVHFVTSTVINCAPFIMCVFVDLVANVLRKGAFAEINETVFN